MIIVYAAILLGILIFVHELGHFLLAKLLGVKVLKFSLGFGPKIIGKTVGETEYRISSVPLGGYVKMLGEEPGEELPETEKHRAYNYQPVWKRVAIVFSGPLFNICFAGVIFFLIFLNGVPVPRPDIGRIEENSPAERAGLMTGDQVVEINRQTVYGWDDIEDSLTGNEGRMLVYKIKRGEELIDFEITPEKTVSKNIFGEDRDVWDIGISPLVPPTVGEVMKGTPSEAAGLRRGDRIVQIEETVLKTWQDMTGIIHGNPGRELAFRIERNGEFIDLNIAPEKKAIKTPEGDDKEIGLIGIKPEGNTIIKKYGVAKALPEGIWKTWDISKLTLVSIVKLFQRIIPAETIGGPILIVQMAGQQASMGALNFFTFMAIISINLGILNLLPIPILDGGHLMFLGIEAVRRKPLSERFVMNAQKIGLAIILTLMVFALYNDVMRLITGKMIP